MESPKPSKKHRIGTSIKRNRKRIVKIIGVLVILGLTAGVSYKAGLNHRANGVKNKTAATLPNLTKLRESAQERLKKSGGATSSSNQPVKNSGFFRLNGAVQSVKKESFVIKLTNGSTVTLTVGEKTKYVTATPRSNKPLTELKSGTTVTVVGTIGSTGTFTANTIQAQK